MKSTWTNTIPCISTAHCPGPEMLKQLEKKAMTAPYEYGAFVFIGEHGDAPSSDLPDWMEPICRWAWHYHGYDCSWVRLDCDGDTIDELPKHEWRLT